MVLFRRKEQPIGGELLYIIQREEGEDLQELIRPGEFKFENGL
jgi:hypothetical protein